MNINLAISYVQEIVIISALLVHFVDGSEARHNNVLGDIYVQGCVVRAL